ncbi:MAG TPA: hypothetical protein VM145_03770 [Sphingomicrobium sp.]|nr:hypothetical protein [Sphingomicrobium sp.]
MRKWLVLAAGPALAASTGAGAQMSERLVAGQAATRALDLRLSEQLGNSRPAPLIRHLFLRHELTPNAAMGLGLANIYAKRKGSAEWRIGEPAPHSRKPAVTFVVKF